MSQDILVPRSEKKLVPGIDETRISCKVVPPSYKLIYNSRFLHLFAIDAILISLRKTLAGWWFGT